MINKNLIHIKVSRKFTKKFPYNKISPRILPKIYNHIRLINHINLIKFINLIKLIRLIKLMILIRFSSRDFSFGRRSWLLLFRLISGTLLHIASIL